MLQTTIWPRFRCDEQQWFPFPIVWFPTNDVNKKHVLLILETGKHEHTLIIESAIKKTLLTTLSTLLTQYITEFIDKYEIVYFVLHL